jgi:hypothetical protein
MPTGVLCQHQRLAQRRADVVDEPSGARGASSPSTTGVGVPVSSIARD